MPGRLTQDLAERLPATISRIMPQLIVFGLMATLAGAIPATAQDAAATAAKPVTVLGTVQAMSGSTVTVKSDAGATMAVTVQDGARLLRIEPGQKSLAGASPFSLVDLQAGDRVMARGAAGADGASLSANLLVAIKGADIAQKQEREREDWQKNGTGGLVKSVDAAASTVTISVGAGGKTEVIHASPTTVVRHYAPGSVKFDQAVKGTLDEIKPGDQLRARGTKSADGGTLEAEEIVSGSFRNLAGPIQSVNTTASTLTLSDTGSKKTIVISMTPDTEVKKLDPAVAQRLAARLSGAKRPEGAAGAGAHQGSGNAGPGGAGPGSAGPGAGRGGPPPGTPSDQAGGGAPRSGAGPDLQQILARSPSVTLKDLQKGNMIIVVATEGQSPETATAITVVAGVEPMLQASSNASQAFSSSWNLGGGGGGEGGGEGQQ
jgi:hypothetical protein